MLLFLKILSGMTNSVDPYQTALKWQSDWGLHFLYICHCASKFGVQNFRTFTELLVSLSALHRPSSVYCTDVWFSNDQRQAS